MNGRNLELATQAGLQQRIDDPNEIWCYRTDLERFAELVRQDEREAVIDIVARHGGSVDIEAAVRQRGEK
jgi:cephalosporin hydroxylase